ncbi:response regulator [Oscillatoria sp. FACHB-1407]|uniref:hybrid sensor histidine kinase/response regulator n=1 Tax=Oscillatoria sp. FACHB-1407 TaxID=2692847 RepID=UPI0016879E1D|nr:ATP-binding protein [Oscillatoria sp. FACHB-1407]MBD2465903.1 response regulator [Oscillatoria sp. FACHB-1407]
MPRVLLIDDNADDRLLAIRELRQAIPNLQVQEVAISEQFSQALAANNFDIVITDYQLHWSNGIALLHVIKAQRPACPVLMFTNSGSQEIAVEAMKAGLDDYVLKAPKHFVRLRTAVCNVLERVKERRHSNQLESRLQSLLHRLEVGVFRATLDGRILESNAAFLKLLGIDNSENQALNLNNFLSVPALSQQLSQIPVQSVQWSRPDGMVIWTRWNMVTVCIDEDWFLDGLVEDITEHKQIELAKVKIEELTQLNQLKDDFLNMVTHDLRAPMTNIKFALQMLKQNVLPEPNGHRSPNKVDHYFQILQQECDREIALINDILDLQQLDSGLHALNQEVIDLEQWLSQVIKPFQERAANRQQNFSVSVTSPLSPVISDQAVLTRILSELLNNACKYTPPQESIVLTVNLERLSAHTASNSNAGSSGILTLTIQNSGVEIPADQLPLIFEKFHRVPGGDRWKQGGTGLGLALVKRMVEQLQGSIEVDSHSEQTCFTVKLPMQICQVHQISS